MSCYIGSNNNRFYVSLEETYGAVGAVSGSQRVAGVRLAAKQQGERVDRRDKTGTRTFRGNPNELRRKTTFEFLTYLTGWGDEVEPSQGPLFEAALGRDPLVFSGGVVGSVSGTQISFTAAHGLIPGQAIANNEEIRFVSAVPSANSVVLNAPFTTITNGDALSRTVTYLPGPKVKSFSLFDFWSPVEAVQRVVAGAGVDELRIRLNGDFHEFEFRGPARDLLDSSSFEPGQCSLEQFPEEPANPADYTLVPGHLGQAWLGETASQFLTVTEAEIVLDNAIETRHREFGQEGVRCLVAGQRTVSASFKVFEQDTPAYKDLYNAAKQRSPISAMFQLGSRAGQMFGVYMHSVVPEVPEFDDRETRLQWNFDTSRAQGGIDDEIAIAFA